jgi:DNA polymerase I-like protein with 3'-5' exonuclease and polymerase domains
VGISIVRIDTTKNPTFTITTVVVPFTCDYNIEFIRQCMSTNTPKVFQNGKFDIAYLLRFAIPVHKYLGDTINLFHSWYSELPKSLDTITAFCLRDWSYWKDESKVQFLSQEYYQYNAKDVFTTALDFLVLMREIPDFVITNYLQEFPVVFPCILSEMTGIKIDQEKKAKLSEEIKNKSDKTLSSIRTMVGSKFYNPSSPVQTQKLWIALGSEDIKGTGKIEQDKIKNRHPINRKIINSIKKYREYEGALSKYIAKDFMWHNRCFYALNPHGTDTGRLASRDSAFNCGLQIQNIKTDGEDISVKEIFIADEDFYLGEADYKQNETYSQAYLSGDPELIKKIEDTTKDFHASNAESFFGLPYSSIVASNINNETQIWEHKVLDKVLRQLAKRVNHGASYNMSDSVLLDTMGIENVIRAKMLLKLPKSWTLIETTQYLLDKFDDTFKVLRKENYSYIKTEIRNTGKLVGPTNWTRICFSDPNSGSKRAMNMYAAHKPQSLSAMVLNKAYLRVFNEIWLENKEDFKLIAQIHDSIIFQYRIGRTDLALRVKECMNIHTPVKDIYGIVHDMNVPVDLKGEATRWSELRSM